MSNLIEQKAKEIASKHALIIELECIKVCEKFKVEPNELIIEYHSNSEIKINVKGANFSITNDFIIKDGSVHDRQ